MSNYDPLRFFLDEVKALYGNTILLFHNAQQADFIAGIWNPQTELRPWKVGLPYSSSPMMKGRNGDEPHVTANHNAILNDIARLGGKLLQHIEINRGKES